MRQFAFEVRAFRDEDMRRFDRALGRGEQLKLQPFRHDLVADAVGHPVPPHAHAVLERQLPRQRRPGIAGGHGV